MELTVIGSGTCVPNPARLPAGFWLAVGDIRLRIDCGSGTVHATGRHGLDWETQTHQFISHFHLDHIADLLPLLFAFKYGRHPAPRGPLQIVGPLGLEKRVRDDAARAMPSILDLDFPLIFHDLAPGESLALDAANAVQLRVAKTAHTAESIALRIDAEATAETPKKSFGYTGDTARDLALADFFHGVDVLVAEVSFIDDALHTAHLTASQAAELAAAAHAKHLVATHCYFDPEADALADRLENMLASQAVKASVTVAADGTRLTW